MSHINSVIPPPTIKTTHEQIASCIKYKVEYTAELESSITSNYFDLKINESDPCNLLDSALNDLERYMEENR